MCKLLSLFASNYSNKKLFDWITQFRPHRIWGSIWGDASVWTATPPNGGSFYRSLQMAKWFFQRSCRAPFWSHMCGCSKLSPTAARKQKVYVRCYPSGSTARPNGDPRIDCTPWTYPFWSKPDPNLRQICGGADGSRTLPRPISQWTKLPFHFFWDGTCFHYILNLIN
jgi:hypothetical protein